MLRQWFRRGKGRNEGKRTRLLNAIGVNTTTPIALGEQRKRKFLFENYLVTPEIPDAVPLDVFVEEKLPGLPEARSREGRSQPGPRAGRFDRACITRVSFIAISILAMC